MKKDKEKALELVSVFDTNCSCMKSALTGEVLIQCNHCKSKQTA